MEVIIIIKKIRKVLILVISFLLIIIFINLKTIAEEEIDDFDYLSDKTEFVYTTDSGLITSKANCIAELENGAIWIGQYVALIKYDGRVFKTYYQVDGIDVTGVSDLLGVGNTLYIGTQQHLVKFKDGIFEEIKLISSSISINELCEYQGLVYIATPIGLFTYNDNTKEIKLLNNKSVDSVSCNHQGLYYVSENKCYNLDGSIYFDDLSVKCVCCGDEYVFIGTHEGKLCIDGVHIVDVTYGSYPINTITEHEHVVYMATDKGLYLYDGSATKIISGLYTNNNLSDLLFDYQGNLWVTSSQNGISKIINNSFTNIFFKNNIENKTVTCVTKYNDLTYVATESGLYIIDEDKKIVIENELTSLLDGVRLRDLEVFNNKLYIATYESEDLDVVIYDGNSINGIDKTKLTIDGEVDYSKSTNIRVITSNEDYLFIGTNYGISRVDKDDNIETIKTKERPLYLYPNQDKLYACFDKNGGLGLYSSDLSFEKIIEGSEDLAILKCYMSSKGLLYNFNSNLYLYKDGKSKKLITNIVGSIFEIFEFNNTLYLGTDTGLYLINVSDLSLDVIPYILLDKASGLASSIKSNASGYFDKDKNLFYFCTSDTVYCYNLVAKENEDIPLKIGVDELIVDGVTIPLDSVSISKSSSRITINISYYNFLLKDDYYVYYMLEGFEDEYHVDNMMDASSITYTNLKGGKYTFKLFAMDSNGVKSLNEISIDINKEKKFFEKIWVIILMILLGALVVFYLTTLIFKYRTKKLVEKQNEYKAITLESIEAIARTIDAKDSYTNGHSTRVGKYSRLIAVSMGLSDEEVENIYYIALLHDIGKIAIPDNILNKPARLTDDEFAIMKSHTTRGAIILSSISTIKDIAAGAKYHHEKYGGGGYPEGLKAGEIPFIARIICCADCYDAMATKRVYKEPYTNEKIISEFEKCSGSQFDPEIAKVVIQMIKDGILTSEFEENK